MYKLHLIWKYLRKRRIAWVSLLAVTLCTAMVLVVISVMGGWLRMFRTSFHGLSGDVVVQAGSLTGFPHYQEIIAEIEKLPEVEAAAPTIQTFGLINIDNQKTMGVQVLGYPMDRIVRINEFGKSLWRQYNQPIEEAQEDKLSPDKIDAIRAQQDKVRPSFGLLPDVDYKQVFQLRNPRAKPALVEESAGWDGMITGTGVVNIRKGADGQLKNRGDYLYRLPVKLTVLGVSTTGNFDVGSKAERNYWIVDTSRTKVWQYDSNTIYVPFDVLQKDLGMEAQQAEDADGKPFTIPARTSDVHVKVKQPWRDTTQGLIEVRDKVNLVVQRVLESKGASSRMPMVRTWEESQATWLNAIENEKVLVTALFGFISIVAIFLIFCIFYMIVAEKTRDIGIIKAVGATSSGVAGIFLGYGATIGLLGAGCGFGIGFLVVRYINEIHHWLGKALGVVIWNPEVYAFDTIPNTMNPKEVFVILSVAVVSSILGALVPAIRAARMNPVEALRWE